MSTMNKYILINNNKINDEDTKSNMILSQNNNSNLI